MVFNREGIIYNKPNPALAYSNGVETPYSLPMIRDRIRRDKNGKLESKANVWICKIGNDYHVLPRGKKTQTVVTANSLRMTNSEYLVLGDRLVLAEPHTTIDTSSAVATNVVSVIVESLGDTYTVQAGAVEAQVQLANFINTSPILSSKVYAVAGVTGSDICHVFAKGKNLYTISTTGNISVEDAVLVANRPIGTISNLVPSGDNYDVVTVTPSVAANAIAVNDIPVGTPIDCPIYSQIMGIFDDAINWEKKSQFLVSPIVGAYGVNIFALNHFDETLRELFPKITFLDN